jgi:hypothetical protein
MRIEALTVCVSYADIAKYTLPALRRQVDRLIVVTTPDDQATHQLCHRLNLETVETDDYYRHGDNFNKGRAIEHALAMLQHDDWVLHIDSDIHLPDDFRESLDDAHLDPKCIYGVDRVMIHDWVAFQKWRDRGSSRQWHNYQYTHGELIGARWCDIRYGYVPIGFFQLWHQSAAGRTGIRTRRYPEWHSNAARADVQFALQWDRRHRQLIPEILVAHIENGHATNGTNWNGRKTPEFGPPKPPLAPVPYGP